MTPAAHHGGTGGNGAATCLLLVPRGYDAPGDLLDGLRQRGVAAQEVGDAPSVMVSLATRRYMALIVVEPSALADSHALSRAVETYYPALPVWQYRRAVEPRLSRYGGSNGAATASPGAAAPQAAPSEVRTTPAPAARSEPPAPAAPQQADPAPPPAARRAPPQEPSREVEPAPEPQSDRPGPLLADLTDEELAMLLDADREPTP